jgi:hypothetical protein
VAAHTQFPPPGAEPVVRGDPTAMVIRFRANGVDQDISTWVFRAYVRERIDGALVNQCQAFEVRSASDLPDLFPTSPGTTPAVLVANWTVEQTAAWASGYVCDIEEMSPVKRTWIIFDSIRVDRDVSNTGGSP